MPGGIDGVKIADHCGCALAAQGAVAEPVTERCHGIVSGEMAAVPGLSEAVENGIVQKVDFLGAGAGDTGVLLQCVEQRAGAALHGADDKKVRQYPLGTETRLQKFNVGRCPPSQPVAQVFQTSYAQLISG
ncbi:MAG: hypothetical protein U5K56_20025 [Halioglobus sp.]|nr:hypothetical protein [Halioglobus sp.]